TAYELREAEKRLHVLQGFAIALDHLDAVIALIRAAADPAAAKGGLVSQFGLSEIQAQEILNLRLQRLTSLERDKILEELRETEFVEHLFVGSTHSYLLFFRTAGRVHWLKVHELPMIGRAARGKPLVNLLQLAGEEKISAILPMREFRDGSYVLFATRRGLVK